MTTISKILLIALALSVVALAQSVPTKHPAKSPTAATTPSASENKKNQDAAAKSSGHTSSMSGNHKDIMAVAADKNQGSASHPSNMVGNHKDVMMATAPSSSGKTQQPGTSSAASPAAQPTAPPNKSTTSDPNSRH
ncbi:MAG: hypothetical protein ABSA78_11250 [Candidatus Sulfotelmatobacter sp.]|jgi:hypothetical protein